MDKCFICKKKLGQNPHNVDTRDNKWVRVGSECYKKIKESGDDGFFDGNCGIRLWLIPEEDWIKQEKKIKNKGRNN